MKNVDVNILRMENISLNQANQTRESRIKIDNFKRRETLSKVEVQNENDLRNSKQW